MRPTPLVFSFMMGEKNVEMNCQTCQLMVSWNVAVYKR